jgi:hypothetical protein
MIKGIRGIEEDGGAFMRHKIENCRHCSLFKLEAVMRKKKTSQAEQGA